MSEDEIRGFLEELSDELRYELGDAVWSFAQIEFLTYQYIGSLSADRIDELVGDVSFRARINILRRMVKRIDMDNNDALSVLKEAEELSVLRNIIVHNPWSVCADLENREFMMQMQNYLKKDKAVTRSELQKFVERANDLKSKFENIFDSLTS